MLMRIQFRTASHRKTPHAWVLFLASFLIGTGAAVPRSQADDSLPPRIKLSDAPEEADDTELPASINQAAKQPAPIKQAANSQVAPEPAETVEPEDVPQRVIGNGFGTMGRASHLAAKTFGRNDSITPLEYMPYLLSDEHFIFADFRGFVTNRSQVGGNMGVGYRRLFDEWNAWGGASAWYDADQSTSKMFQQVGLSFEGLIQQFEVRSNVYLPFTSSTQTISNSISNASIVGNQLLYSRATNVGNALRGIDAEVGYSLPVLDRHVVRGYVGGYHFEGGPTGGVNGFKARVEGVINNTITAQALYTHDKLYGDNFMVGLSMQFPFGNDHPTTGWFRNTPSPFRFVERNYNVIVDQSQGNAVNQVAADPKTGNPYLVEQVYAPASGAVSATPNGTSANPFSSVAAAQAAGGNVIFVQSGSVLNQAITLAPGQHLIGQGNSVETLATTGGGSVRLPNLLQASLQATPVIQNVPGTAVTLASNTEVAGFNIIGSTGSGITGTGVSGVSLHDLTFSSIGGDAINLTNSSGSVTIRNTQITSAVGNGIVFNGGNPNITYDGAGATITAQGNGFVLENLTGGTIAINDLSLKNIGGTGLILDSVATDATFESLAVSQSGMNGPAGSAVSISGMTGVKSIFNTYNFLGNTTITSPNGAGFSVSGTDAIINVTNLNVTSSSSLPAISLANATSEITLERVTVNTKNAMGLSAEKVTELQVNAGSFTTVNAPAIDIESSAVNATLGSVSVNGGPYGIKLEASTGSFLIQGNQSLASGGTIQNTTTGILINSFGNTSVNWLDLVNNGVGIQSTGSTQLALYALRINGSTGYALDSLNDVTLSLENSILSGNGAVGGGTIRVQADTVTTYTTNFQSNTITDPNGTAIQIQTQANGAGATLSFQVYGNTISSSGSGASVIGTNWSGPLTAYVAGNTITATGPNMTAIALQDPSTSAIMTATINSNLIYFNTAAATSGTGIWVIDGQSGQKSTVTSTVTMQSNTMTFQGTEGTGLRFGLYGLTTDAITKNIIVDQAGGATGMLFDYVASNTIATLTTNGITLKAGDTLTHRGIIFTQVAPTFTLTNPTGTPAALTNFIYNLASPADALSIPAGTTVGGILINGTFMTPP